MIPQLVAPSLGLRNEDLALARGQILEGGSWKKQRIVMLVPSAAMIAAKVYLAHRSLIFPPNQPMYPMLCLGMEVGEAYSSAIAAVLAHPELSQWEYILTIEHDNIPPPDGVIKLLRRMEAHPEFACIGGLYWTKGPGGVPQIWGDAKDPQLNFRPQPPDANGGLVECCGTGMGFNLWRVSLFRDEKLRRPWFKTVAGAEGVGTQDLYAWADFKAHGYRCAIDCDVRVGHHDAGTDVSW